MKKVFLKLTSFSLIAGLALTLSACSSAPSNHYISVSSSNIRAGTVSGFGNYKTDYEVKLTASPLEGNSFLAWIKNDVIVSYDAEYKFTANNDTEGDYCALFATPQVEFFKLNNIDYSATGVGLNDPELTITKVLDIDISWSKISTLYSPFASFNEALVGNTGNFQSQDFNTQDFVLFKNNTYYFSANFKYEHSNLTTGDTTTGEFNKKFAIDFSNLNLATESEGVLTYANTEYTLTQSTEGGVTTITARYNNLPLSNEHIDTMEHYLTFSFVYPFEKPAEDVPQA